MTKTQQEIIKQGYQALIDSLGVVDAIRFINYFNLGQGDYTQDRHQWLNQTPLDEILLSMKQHREDESNQYDEIIDN
ncbi:hypothetical protein [Planktothrix agardhii]|jgi:hypothetical protein|uniref:hypothetical protein n=1 Tax=Planktothrix agardhii TaxID=1160 RepID=UPI000DBB700B|nr:hypothetical protein [Planktothrix agardhii]MCB8762050.1 hypothetical protein [Planktothrix agardhii 1813]MCF3607995.1 hypothetical protein [Planktothrix agardhii 1033]BBD57133.1 hypothetical protein NIES204_44690 [Planktothrix agardhii NIES-204]CAD5984729.1 hypothetical protein PCC7811_04503 [Planktothrix agardhii]